MNKFCFCVSAFNEEETIEDCILSIIKILDNHDASLFIVDNGSTDSTKKIIERILDDHPFDFHSFSKNLTLQESRNFLLNNCKADYAIFVDADGKVSENYLDILDYNLSGEVSIYSGLVIENRKKNLYYEIHYKSLMDSDYYFLIGSNFVVRRKDALKSGGFPNLTYNRGDETPLIIQMKLDNRKHLYIRDLIATNDFANNFKDFFRFGAYEGTNSYICTNAFKNHNLILKTLFRLLWPSGILLILFGFYTTLSFVFLGLALFSLKVLRQRKYWFHVLLNTYKNFSLQAIFCFACVLTFNLIFDIAFLNALIRGVKPRNEITNFKT